MAVMNVNPTRMELTNLKRKLSTARRGHKLLKDKRDELMRRFLDLVKENKALRIRVEEGIKQANVNMEIARSAMNDKSLSVAMMLPTQEMSLESSEKNVMSVMIPVFDVQYKTADRNDIYSYGTAFTSAELDNAGQRTFGDNARYAETCGDREVVPAARGRDRKNAPQGQCP